MASPRGIQSIEVGGRLLQALAGRGLPMALKDLAQAAAMAPAKAHPYLVSFAKLGLVEQDDVTGRYGLGPFAMQLGLIGLAQQDPVRLAFPVVEQLAQQLGHTVAVAVWGEHGPVIVRVAEAPSPIHVVMRHGNDWSAVPEHRLESAQLSVVDLVTLPGVDGFKSRREAKQRIEQGAVKINGEPCLDPGRLLTAGDCDGDYLRLQAGKKTRVRVYFPR